MAISPNAAVCAGKTYLGPGLSADLVKEYLEEGETTTALTPREGEVLKLIAQGHKNREIADELGIAIKTVETVPPSP